MCRRHTYIQESEGCNTGILCDLCESAVSAESYVWTCRNGYNTVLHPTSYDVCMRCFEQYTSTKRKARLSRRAIRLRRAAAKRRAACDDAVQRVERDVDGEEEDFDVVSRVRCDDCGAWCEVPQTMMHSYEGQTVFYCRFVGQRCNNRCDKRQRKR